MLQPEEKYALAAILNAMRPCTSYEVNFAERHAAEVLLAQLPKVPHWLAVEVLRVLLRDNPEGITALIDEFTSSRTREQRQQAMGGCSMSDVTDLATVRSVSAELHQACTDNARSFHDELAEFIVDLASNDLPHRQEARQRAVVHLELALRELAAEKEWLSSDDARRSLVLTAAAGR